MARAALWAGLAVVAGLVLPQAGLAADAGAGPAAKFTAAATTEMFICGSKFQIVAMGASKALPEAVECAKNAKAEVEPYYAAAKAKFLKKPEALALTIEFYLVWQTSMDELTPRAGETEIGYSGRLEAMTSELRQRGRRLNLEE